MRFSKYFLENKSKEEVNSLFMEFSLEVDNFITNILEPVINNRLADEPSQLEIDAKNIETYNYYLATLLSDSESFLSYYKFLELPAKSKEISDLDRRITLEMKIVDKQNIRDKLVHISDAINRRLSLIQSFLKFYGERLKQLGE